MKVGWEPDREEIIWMAAFFSNDNQVSFHLTLNKQNIGLFYHKCTLCKYTKDHQPLRNWKEKLLMIAKMYFWILWNSFHPVEINSNIGAKPRKIKEKVEMTDIFPLKSFPACYFALNSKESIVLLKYRISFHLVKNNIFFSMWYKGWCGSFISPKPYLAFKILPFSSFVLDWPWCLHTCVKTITQVSNSSTLIFK